MKYGNTPIEWIISFQKGPISTPNSLPSSLIPPFEFYIPPPQSASFELPSSPSKKNTTRALNFLKEIRKTPAPVQKTSPEEKVQKMGEEMTDILSLIKDIIKLIRSFPPKKDNPPSSDSSK